MGIDCELYMYSLGRGGMFLENTISFLTENDLFESRGSHLFHVYRSNYDEKSIILYKEYTRNFC